MREYGNPCQHFCPAAVYEMVMDKGEPRLKINAGCPTLWFVRVGAFFPAEPVLTHLGTKSPPLEGKGWGTLLLDCNW